MPRIAGTLFVSLSGTQFEMDLTSVNAPALEIKTEPVPSVTNAAAGVKQTAQLQYLKFTALVTPDFPLQSLRNLSNGTLTAQFANGMTYTLGGAFLAQEPEIDGYEGKMTLEFNGNTGTWS